MNMPAEQMYKSQKVQALVDQGLQRETATNPLPEKERQLVGALNREFHARMDNDLKGEWKKFSTELQKSNPGISFDAMVGAFAEKKALELLGKVEVKDNKLVIGRRGFDKNDFDSTDLVGAIATVVSERLGKHTFETDKGKKVIDGDALKNPLVASLGASKAFPIDLQTEMDTLFTGLGATPDANQAAAGAKALYLRALAEKKENSPNQALSADDRKAVLDEISNAFQAANGRLGTNIDTAKILSDVGTFADVLARVEAGTDEALLPLASQCAEKNSVVNQDDLKAKLAELKGLTGSSPEIAEQILAQIGDAQFAQMMAPQVPGGSAETAAPVSLENAIDDFKKNFELVRNKGVRDYAPEFNEKLDKSYVLWLALRDKATVDAGGKPAAVNNFLKTLKEPVLSHIQGIVKEVQEHISDPKYVAEISQANQQALSKAYDSIAGSVKAALTAGLDPEQATNVSVAIGPDREGKLIILVSGSKAPNNIDGKGTSEPVAFNIPVPVGSNGELLKPADLIAKINQDLPQYAEQFIGADAAR